MPDIYQIKITLPGSKPPIRRRIQFPRPSQALRMTPDPAKGDGLDGFVHARVQCRRAELRRSRLRAGDGRRGAGDLKRGGRNGEGQVSRHVGLRRRLRKSAPGREGALGRSRRAFSRSVTGKWRFPPKDCGGIRGDARLAEVLQDPQHPGHGDMNEGYEGRLDPEPREDREDPSMTCVSGSASCASSRPEIDSSRVAKGHRADSSASCPFPTPGADR